MARILALTLLTLFTLFAPPVNAQQVRAGTVRVQRDTTRGTVTVVSFEREIEQLARELINTVERQATLRRSLAEISMRSRFASSSTWGEER